MPRFPFTPTQRLSDPQPSPRDCWRPPAQSWGGQNLELRLLKGVVSPRRGRGQTENWVVELPFPVWSHPILEGRTRDQQAVSPFPMLIPLLSVPGSIYFLVGKQSINFYPFCVEIVWTNIFVLILCPLRGIFPCGLPSLSSWSRPAGPWARRRRPRHWRAGSLRSGESSAGRLSWGD